MMLPLTGLPGVLVLLLARRRRNLRPHLLSLLDCAPPRELFASANEEESAGGGSREESVKQGFYLYTKYMKATDLLLGVVSVSSKEEDEERRKAEKLKNRRSTTVDEWKKLRSHRGEPGIHLCIKM